MSSHFYPVQRLGRSRRSQQRFPEAERQWHKALEEAMSFSKDDGRYCLCLEKIGRLYDGEKRYEKAEGLYKEALQLRKAHDSKNQKDLATAYNNLAAVQFKLGRYDEAEKNYTEALTIREKEFGKSSKEAAVVIYQVGMIFHKQKKYPQAEDYYKRALDIKNKVFGPNHKELIHILRNYANLLKKTGRESTADQMYQFADSIEKKNS
ncbi:MAG: tetratricopeptide repeat protein [Cyanobacteriota/Melainabacteria group bacterium]